MSRNRIIHDGLRVITRFTHSRTEGSKQNRRKEEGAVVWVGRCQREASSLSLSWNSEDKHKLGKRNWVKRTGLRCSLDILSCFISCCCRCSFPIGRFSSSRNSLLHQPCGLISCNLHLRSMAETAAHMIRQYCAMIHIPPLLVSSASSDPVAQHQEPGR